MELNEKGRHWGGQPFLAYGRLAKLFASEKEANGFDPPVTPAFERPAPYPCPVELCQHIRRRQWQEQSNKLQPRTFSWCPPSRQATRSNCDITRKLRKWSLDPGDKPQLLGELCQKSHSIAVGAASDFRTKKKGCHRERFGSPVLRMAASLLWGRVTGSNGGTRPERNRSEVKKGAAFASVSLSN